MKDRLKQLGTFCSMTPVADEAALRAELAGWPPAAGSPFGRLETVHFARLVVIPELHQEEPGQPLDRLDSPYLVFSCFYDGDRDSFLQALCDRLADECDAVFRHCVGHPGHPREVGAEFREWLGVHRVPATQIFAPYPQATVREVREALEFRRRFRAFAFGLNGERRVQESVTAFAEEQA